MIVTKTTYNCKSRINEKRINGALLTRKNLKFGGGRGFDPHLAHFRVCASKNAYWLDQSSAISGSGEFVSTMETPLPRHVLKTQGSYDLTYDQNQVVAIEVAFSDHSFFHYVPCTVSPQKVGGAQRN